MTHIDIFSGIAGFAYAAREIWGMGYLDDGRKFVSIEEGEFILGKWIWVEKLPNGFYREK